MSHSNDSRSRCPHPASSRRRHITVIATLGALLTLAGCHHDSSGTVAQTYTLGGTISGLGNSTGLVLANGSSTVTVNAGATSFTLSTGLASGTSYAVTAQTQPAGETCTVAGGTGTIGTANVANIVVTCSDQAFALGGTISGLSATGLVLANGSDTLAVSSGATSFTIPTNVAYTSSYAVTVQTQPAGVGCAVSNGTGTMPASAVTNISVTCTDQPSTVGGTISGLGNSPGLMLSNGTDTLSVSAGATSFTMPTPMAPGTTYAVSVMSSPAGLTCTVSNGSGTIAAANVVNVAISCADQAYALGGTISGLMSSGLVLANGSDTLTVSSGATGFTMPTNVAYTSSYAVTVQTQPSGEICTVSSGSGTMGTGNVTNVSVTCALVTYTVGGTISGLAAGGLVLLNNGSDATTINANATQFTMTTGQASGSNYAVTVQTQPAGETCTVSNGMGAVSSVDVSSVTLTCVPQTFTTSLVHAFGSVGDGVTPTGTPIQGSDGNFYGVTQTGGANGKGMVFKVTPSGTETVLYSFAASGDGANPQSGVIQASDGNFYGTTSGGGAQNYGTVFKVTPGGTETVVYSFEGGASDGQYPYSGLLQASDGNFYGVVPYGGANGDGVVFKLTPSGTETVLYAFTGGSDGETPVGTLIQASDGNFYGVTQYGGTNFYGAVFKLTPSGTETTLYSFGSTGDGYNPVVGLIQASDGNFYGVAQSGGANGKGAVFKLTPSGTETLLYSFANTTNDGSYSWSGVIQASDGNFYGTTDYGGTGNEGMIFQVTPGGTETIVHSFMGGTGDGAYPQAGLIQASDGNFYGVTSGGGPNNNSGTIYKVTP